MSPIAAVLLAVLASGSDTRVSRKVLVKEGHVFVSAGPTWLSRGDYYDNPGAVVSASTYFDERHGLELRVAGFASSLGRAAQEVFDATGTVPDAHRPIALATIGYRGAFGYGKFVVAGALIHFDLQASAHVGTLLTDRHFTPSAALGPGMLFRLGPTLHLQLDVPLTASVEKRRRGGAVFGVLPMLTLGARL